MPSSKRSALALLLNDDDSLELGPTVAAMVIRDAMEEFHAEHLTDAQEAALNPIIRDAIYTALYAIQHGEEEPWCQRFFEHPKYTLIHLPDCPKIAEVQQTGRDTCNE